MERSVYPKTHIKLSIYEVPNLPRDAHKRLSRPLELFHFDFANGDLREILKGRARPGLKMPIEQSGILSHVLLYFTLHCDSDPANHYHSGPANEQLVAWDQSMRAMPVELQVKPPAPPGDSTHAGGWSPGVVPVAVGRCYLVI